MTIGLYETNGQPLKLPQPAGYWIEPTGISFSSTISWGTGVTDYAAFLPVLISQPMTISEMAIYLTSGQAGAECELALYFNDPSTDQPGGQVGTCGIVPLTSTTAGLAIGTFPSPLNIAPGIYWLACAMKATGLATMPSFIRSAGQIAGLIPPMASGADLSNGVSNRFYLYQPSGFTACASPSQLLDPMTGLLANCQSQGSNTAYAPVMLLMRSA